MRGNALFENLLVLEAGGAAFIVGLYGALMAGMAIWSAVLVTRHGPARFGQPDLALASGWPSFFAVPEPGRPSVRPAASERRA